MTAGDVQAVVILFDNSMSSINGDFAPNRLAAQKDAVEVLARTFLARRESRVGFGTLAGKCGINTSLTSEARKLRINLESVTRDGEIHFEQAVKCGLYALKHRPKIINTRHMIILLGSKHDLTMEKA